MVIEKFPSVGPLKTPIEPNVVSFPPEIARLLACVETDLRPAIVNVVPSVQSTLVIKVTVIILRAPATGAFCAITATKKVGCTTWRGIRPLGIPSKNPVNVLTSLIRKF